VRPALVLAFLLAYVVLRGALGALLNPPFNGPDEGGHWEYLESWTAGGGRAVTGVERSQPPLYYALASLPFRLTEGAPVGERLFTVRLLSVAAGVVTAGATWLSARWLWPGHPLLALLAAGVAVLAPGHLFLLASVNNDPLATALASVAGVAAVRLWLSPGVGKGAPSSAGLLVWAVASILAVAAKLTALPVVLGMALALAWRYRGVAGRVGRRVLLGAGVVGVAAGFVVYARLLGEPPSTSRWASMAHFWSRTLWIALPEYVRGGLAESFGTFWYAYDYAVRWPLGVGAALALVGAILLLGAMVGLVWAGARGGRRALLCALPLLLWLGAGAQVATVILRFGFGTVLQIEMGGVAQAKGFFPALLPLALLFTWGWVGLYRALGGRDERWLTLGILGAFYLLDWISLGVTLWHHYRWLQVGL
jgi:hypothetical protein